MERLSKLWIGAGNVQALVFKNSVQGVSLIGRCVLVILSPLLPDPITFGRGIDLSSSDCFKLSLPFRYDGR